VSGIAKFIVSQRNQRDNAIKAIENYYHIYSDKSWALAFSSPFNVDSEDIGHSKRDYDLQFTEWTRFQADHAHIYVMVVEVAAYEKPSTLRNRCIKCQSLG
jgi:hypothetical protein